MIVNYHLKQVSFCEKICKHNLNLLLMYQSISSVGNALQQPREGHGLKSR